jgi:ATP-dependent Clp protease ATP-binding subunit ClpA
MLDDVSPAVERAFESARQKSTDGGINAVHLFLALIEDDEGRAAQVLIEAGGDLIAIRRGLASHPHIALELPAVISAAREAAGDRAESTVTGEYLLVGMVRAVRILHPVLHQAGTSVDRIIQTNELPPISIPESLELRDTVDIV